jgi:hypothetical protein
MQSCMHHLPELASGTAFPSPALSMLQVLRKNSRRELNHEGKPKRRVPLVS